MPPYRYESFINPYVGSIAENLGRSADAKARGLELAAQARARGQEISGQAWGNAASDIGRTVAGTIAAYDNPRRKLDEAQLQDVRQRQAGEQKLSSLLTPYQPNGPQPEGAGPAPAQHPYLDEQGLYDIPKLSDALASSGMAHLAPDLLKGAEQINGSILEHQKRQADLGAAETVMLGDMANGARQLVKAGVPITQAIDLAAAPGIATGRFSQQQTDQIKAKLATLPPEQQDAALGTLMDAAAQIAPSENLAEGAKKVDRYKRVTAENPKPVPVEKPTEASIAMAAASGDPVASAAMDRLKPKVEKAPLPREQQLLEAIASGDTVKAKQITDTYAAEAKAKRDPVAAAQLEETRKLTREAAQARLDAQTEKNKPLDIAPDIQTTRSGHQFIDLSQYSVGERDKARTAAAAAGAVPVSKEVASAMQDLDTARANQADILAQIQDKLPKGPGRRLLAAPIVKLEKIFQTDEEVAAFNTWRTAAIQTMRATAGSKGLRINRSEIEMAIQNDIPKLTDTLATAQQKVANINKMLDNIENSALVRDRSALVPEKPPTGPPEPMTLNPYLAGVENRK